MMKRLLMLLAVFMLGTVSMFAQHPVVSILGGSTSVGWTGDLDMATTDGVTYTYSSLVVTVPATDAGVKFRQAHAWTVNWGATAFPTGTAAQNGANIPATNGTYNVTFNRTTGAYSFVPVGVSYDVVALVGNGATYTLTTGDGINYAYPGLMLTAGSYYFTVNGSGHYGANGFPTDTAVANGNITVQLGTYDLTFVHTSMVYNFGFPQISLVGSAIDPDWAIDVDLVTTDGVLYTKMGLSLTAGDVKFRQSHAWETSWGSVAFPTGTGTLGGENIPVTPGVYNVTFNKSTGEYSFMYSMVSLTGSAIAPDWGVDIDLVTTDGINYSTTQLTIANGELKFRQNHSWDVNWGSASFPSGVGTQGGANIIATAGTYDVTFNRTTGLYTFTASGTTIDVIALAGGSTPIVLLPNDGVNYYASSVMLAGGTYHFTINGAGSYGGDFPMGTAMSEAVIAIPAGIYDIMYNDQTGAYSFTYPMLSLIGSAIDTDWSVDIDMETTDGITYSKTAVVLANGEVKFRLYHDWNAGSWGAAVFPAGNADLGGANIPVTAGTYDVTFNRETRAFNFAVTAGTNVVTKNNVSVYPNPSATGWNFSAADASLTNIKVTDVMGKTVINQTVNGQTASVNITALSAGVYFASVTANGATTVVRVVKN
jgi:starch-binding outer membrane protein SusE/F